MGALLRSTFSNSSHGTLRLQSSQNVFNSNMLTLKRAMRPIPRVSVVALAGKGKGNKGFSKNVREHIYTR